MATPFLSALFGELQTLHQAGHIDRPGAAANHYVHQRGELTRVTWPGVGDFQLTAPQLRVVESLMDAYMRCTTPDVGEDYLIRHSGKKARRLAELFRSHPAWGLLIVPGDRPATFRLAEAAAEPEPEVTRVEVEDDD